MTPTLNTRGPALGTHGPGGVQIPYFVSLEWQVSLVSPYVRGLFPSKETRRISERDDPVRPLYQGVRGSVWDPEPSPERVGDWGGPATVWSLLCVAETRATRPNGEWGYSTRRQCWATSAQRRCHPEEALYLPNFSHVFVNLIVNKLFSLSLSLSLARSLARDHIHCAHRRQGTSSIPGPDKHHCS